MTAAVNGNTAVEVLVLVVVAVVVVLVARAARTGKSLRDRGSGRRKETWNSNGSENIEDIPASRLNRSSDGRPRGTKRKTHAGSADNPATSTIHHHGDPL